MLHSRENLVFGKKECFVLFTIMFFKVFKERFLNNDLNSL